MVFSSSIFLFLFLPIVLFVYYAVRYEFQNIVLLIASLLFYSWGEPKYVFIMLISIFLNYYLGLWIAKTYAFKRVILILAVVCNIGLLFVFKYLGFTVRIVNTLFGSAWTIPEIALPIGISFYTFQSLSYIIDLYFGKVKVQKDLYKLALYISLFPQLIAGPIVRYADISLMIDGRSVTKEGFGDGALRFMKGFSKKILIADQLAPLADTAFSGMNSSVFLNWAGMIAYTLQIYFDFSGYSDMAIGLGKMFGFDFLENFNYPYISESMQEFWRRWHISLSTWFRDYVYIPLGGSRRGGGGYLSESDFCVRIDRALAWREFHIYRMGIVSCVFSMLGTNGSEKGTGKDAMDISPYLCYMRVYDWLGVLSSGYYLGSGSIC